MANENPTRGRRAVPLDLPAEHTSILRSWLSDWIAGARDDLASPVELKDPDGALRACRAFERLLSGVSEGRIFVPDDDARTALEAAATAADAESNYSEVVATHDAHHALLALLEGQDG